MSFGEMGQKHSESEPASQLLKPAESWPIRKQGPLSGPAPCLLCIPNPLPPAPKKKNTPVSANHPSQAPRATSQNFARKYAFYKVDPAPQPASPCILSSYGFSSGHAHEADTLSPARGTFPPTFAWSASPFCSCPPVALTHPCRGE